MAASAAATMAVGGVFTPVKNVSSLSSLSASGSTSLVNVGPLRPQVKRNVAIVRAALPEEQGGKAARREMLAGLLAAGAALVASGGAVAASGPGTAGAKRTNEKAGELLKAADDFTNNDSPPRFGPGRVENAGNAGRIAQQGGAGAIQELQGGTNKAVEDAKQRVEEGKTRIVDQLFGKKNKKGDLAIANTDAGDKIASGLQSTGEKVKSDVSTTGDKVKSDISSTSEKVGKDAGGLFGFGNKSVAETKDRAGDFVAQAKDKADNATSDGKNVFEDLVDKAQNIIPQ